MEKRLVMEKEKQKEEERQQQEELRRREEEERLRLQEIEKNKILREEQERLRQEQHRRDEDERRRKFEAERLEADMKRRQFEEEKRRKEEEERRQKEELERIQREEEARRRQAEEERQRQENERIAAEKAAEERRKKDELLARLRASDNYKNDKSMDNYTLSPPPEQIDDDSGRGTDNGNTKTSHKTNYKTENLHQGRPALSTEDDYYGTKSISDKSKPPNSHDKSQNNKEAKSVNEEISPIARQKPTFGRRADGNQGKKNQDGFDVFNGGDDDEDYLMDAKPKKFNTTGKKTTTIFDDDDDDGENPFDIPVVANNKSNPGSRRSKNRDTFFDSPQAGSRNDNNKSKSSSIFGDDDDLLETKPSKTTKSNIIQLNEDNDDNDIFNQSPTPTKSLPWDKKESNTNRVTLGRQRAPQNNVIKTKTAIEDFGFEDDLEEINL